MHSLMHDGLNNHLPKVAHFSWLHLVAFTYTIFTSPKSLFLEENETNKKDVPLHNEILFHIIIIIMIIMLLLLLFLLWWWDDDGGGCYFSSERHIEGLVCERMNEWILHARAHRLAIGSRCCDWQRRESMSSFPPNRMVNFTLLIYQCFLYFIIFLFAVLAHTISSLTEF